jgi:N-ethylmaleimide reductase
MNRKKGLKLFTPVQLGSLNLKHRVVMAPLTRSRSEQPGGIPGDMMVQYYSDRASDGGLIVGEATNISLTARDGMVRPVFIQISRLKDGRAL